jgi:hypothetical protein
MKQRLVLVVYYGVMGEKSPLLLAYRHRLMAAAAVNRKEYKNENMDKAQLEHGE